MKKAITKRTKMAINESLEGETIEMKIERVTTMKEPIADNAELIYTERKDGILPAFDIRTDRLGISCSRSLFGRTY